VQQHHAAVAALGVLHVVDGHCREERRREERKKGRGGKVRRLAAAAFPANAPCPQAPAPRCPTQPAATANRQAGPCRAGQRTAELKQQAAGGTHARTHPRGGCPPRAAAQSGSPLAPTPTAGSSRSCWAAPACRWGCPSPCTGQEESRNRKQEKKGGVRREESEGE
jgi:hypothetical protein